MRDDERDRVARRWDIEAVGESILEQWGPVFDRLAEEENSDEYVCAFEPTADDRGSPEAR